MAQLRWIGPALPPLARALEQRGLPVTDGDRRSTTDTISLVVTIGRDIPKAPGGPWLWLCDREVALSAAQEAARRRAHDVLCYGDAPASIAERLAERVAELLARESDLPPTPGLIADSPAARMVLRQVWQAARTTMPVLLTGETGTGKEVLANLLHLWSGRPGVYVPVNCAAIPNELMESELFGHVRGAFSGAVATVDGKLLAAQGGTVFLDEIDDTPLSTQNKLLRVLEDGQVTRVGETRGRSADFRLVAATNRDLVQLIAEGRFGRDFFERLAIVRIELPTLAQRREDIPAFVRHFIARFYERQGRAPEVTEVAPHALAFLSEHAWPGNIRELRNLVYQALVYKRAGRELLLSDLRPALERARSVTPSVNPLVASTQIEARIAAGNFDLRQEVETLEREAVRAALARSGGRMSVAARLLGRVGRGRSADPGGTVRAMMRRLGLTAAVERPSARRPVRTSARPRKRR